MTPGLEYHQLHRAERWSWWRPLVGAVSVLGLLFVVLPVVLMVPFLVLLALAGAGAEDVNGFLTFDPVTPLSLAYLLLTLAGGIHLTIAATAVLHRLTPGWLVSVVGRIRWSWLVVCLALSMVALGARIVVGLLVPVAPDEAAVEQSLNPVDLTMLAFAVVILLATPLQAAGEEFVFRGYLTQAVGGCFRPGWAGRLAAVLVPAFVFALAHGAQDPPIFVDRFAFGIVAGVLVIATGGLEAAIAMHVLNNFLAFGLAVLFGDLSSALEPTSGTWWSLPLTLAQSLVYLGLALLVGRAMGLSTRTPAARPIGGAPVLAPPNRSL
ncbi:CPBP family intramembrane glutamic endopeptidase [Nocardioides insulae]|uniref:CPBP family intramembrane glutamic endopeptidase n=1 Tax=Nocardioides insulae TaxID=394734 RepID=UPI00040BC5D6|nr:CPBP family intramembrane glutamic endopeptidase [Nocardioides insulae]